MRVLLVLLMSSCAVVSAWLSDGRWLAAQMEREWLAMQAYRPPRIQATPTAFGLPLPVLRVGMEVRVQMLEHEWLNLRDAPDTTSAVLALLRDGTRLTLLEGPLQQGGYRWWRVQAGGREGWCVEETDTVLAITMLPTATPVP